MEEKGVGNGRSGRAWGLEAGESRGAGPARRGKSQGPGEAVLERGARGRAEPRTRGLGRRRNGGEGFQSVGKPGSGEPRGPRQRRW